VLGFEILPGAGADAEQAGASPPHHDDPSIRPIILAYLEQIGMVAELCTASVPDLAMLVAADC
jgi:hypothetical protein